jgi:hypothetical protein
MIFKDFSFKYDNSHYACASYYPEIESGKEGGGGVVLKIIKGKR